MKKVDYVLLGYDIASSNSTDMSCISYVCGKCKHLIDCEIYDLSRDWNMKDKEKYLDSEKTNYKVCPNCKTEFKKEVKLNDW